MTEGISDKLATALKDGLCVRYKTKNSRLLYSMMNRPEPTASGVGDAALCAAILHAGSCFDVKKVPRSKALDRDTTQRSDGHEVVYRESIDIDWDGKVIRSTKGREMTLRVLSIVVRDLSASVAAAETKKAPRELN
jgi:hypothetical protein